jgi:hypothetical protein
MTQAPGPHLSADEVENWLSGTLDAERSRHLDLCPECFDLAQVEREIVEQLSALPSLGPSAGFADRVMASVRIADPFALRSLQTVRQRIFATRRSLAIAAGLVLALVGSMAASVAWTLANQDVLASVGDWVLMQSTQAGWVALRGLASNFIEQPWYESARALAGHPGRLATAIGVARQRGSGAGLLAERHFHRPDSLIRATRHCPCRAAVGAGRLRGSRAGQEFLGSRREPAGHRPAGPSAAASHLPRA